MKKKKAALVLSGGGSMGVAHVGALEALQEQYEFDYICGVSAGAIVGAALAAGKTTQEMADIFNETSLFDMAWDFSPKNSGLMKGRKIYELLKTVYQNQSFADLDVDLYVGTTDFGSGERFTISEGQIADAVRASMSIPVVFEPVEHPLFKRTLVDGFLSKNFPIDHAIEHYQGDTIIGIDVATVPPLSADFGKAKFWGKQKVVMESLQRITRIMYHNQNVPLPEDPRLKIYKPDLKEYSSTSLWRKNFKAIRERGRQCVENHS